MRPSDVFLFAWTSLASNRTRTLLMLFAMSIGVAAVVMLTGIGNGARLYITDQFSSLGANLLIIIPGRTETAGNTPATLVGETPRPLTLEDAQALRRARGIGMVAPLIIGELSASHAGKNRPVPVLGSTAPFLHIHQLRLASGKFLPVEETSSSRPVCVLGDGVRRELFGNQEALGALMQLGAYRCRVSGVLAPQGRSLGMDTEELVIVPVGFAQMLFNTDALFRIVLEAREKEGVELAKERVRAVIKKRHHGEDDITIITQDSVLAAFDRMFRALTLTVAAIASISLLVAGILIMNVMLMTVSQRRMEIGLCKALGASGLQVMLLIVNEALLLSASGGVAGLALGFGGARLMVEFYPNLHTTPPLWAVLAALGAALGTGFLFSLLPAGRAARLDPIQALAGR